MTVVRRMAIAAVVAVLAMGSATVATAAPGDPLPTLSGPDVSGWNHPLGACIDWQAVAAGGRGVPARQFAFIKATEGSTYVNPYFNSCAKTATKGDWAATAAAGLARGAYHYARPQLPLSSAVSQARYFVSIIGPQNLAGTLPPVLDLEESGGLSPAQLVLWTQIWLDDVRTETGRVPIIYTYPNFWPDRMANTEAFHAYPLWIADYRGDPTGPLLPLAGNWPAWTMWQWSAYQPQIGVTGRVDMSWFNGDATALAALADGTVTVPWVATAPHGPTKVTAVAGNGAATIAWVPADNGGALVTSYVVKASDGTTITVDGQSSTATFPGLVNGTSYTFAVAAVNALGQGTWSSGTKAVVPQVPTQVVSALTADSVVYGNATAMTATLTRTDTQEPLGAQTLTVWQRPAGTTEWTQVGAVVTDANGLASFPFTPEVSTDTRMIWVPATPEFHPQTTLARTVTVTAIPTSITATLSKPVVTAGGSTVVTGILRRTDTGAAVPGASVDIFTRTAGTTGWTQVASVPTSLTGRLTWSFAPPVNSQVQVRWAAPVHWTSPLSVLSAAVRPTISGALSASSTTVLHVVRARGVVGPSLSGRPVFRQVLSKGVWVTVARALLSATSTYSFPISVPRVGTYAIRILVPPSSLYTAASSRVWTLTVR